MPDPTSWRFYLGTHEVHWLALDIGPLFVSHRRLASRVRLPRAAGPWALDSGGFTELALHGEWRSTPAQYIDAVRRYVADIGRMDWAAPMDWMCEPAVLAATGLTIAAHQQRTVANFAALRAAAPDLPFVPVLQGWHAADYERCIALYAAHGVDLWDEPLVGVGSICRRQATADVRSIVHRLADTGLSLHGFGVKTRGLASFAGALASADSLAWSYRARRDRPLPGCSHQRCSNCVHYATRWRSRLLSDLHPQLSFQLPASDPDRCPRQVARPDVKLVA